MSKSIRILLQCSIPYAEDDWHVGRFSLLREELSKVADVVARNLEPDRSGKDPMMSKISRSSFDELWLLGVDGGTGLSKQDCGAINAFHREGGGLLTPPAPPSMTLCLRQLPTTRAPHSSHNPI